MVPPPISRQEQIEWEKQQKEVKRIEEERKRQIFNKTNINVTDNYFFNLLKNISWKINNMFSFGDKQDILRSTSINVNELNKLISTGLSKNNPSGNEFGMWRELNTTITGKPGVTIENYFENIYTKLACCLGKDTITVPVPYRGNDGVIYRKEVTIKVDRKKECTINGINWNDDNTTELGHNPNCQRLFERLIAFLSKLDPENPMLNTYGGCIANKNIDSKILANPTLFSIVDANRSCTVSSCSGQAYKRKRDRKNCETTLCNAEINISDIEAGSALNILGNSIEQTCGPQSKIAKSLESGKEEAEKQVEEQKEEADKKTKDIQQEQLSKAEKELQKAEEKLQEADTLAEKEVAQKEIDRAEKKVIQKAKVLNETPLHKTFFYNVQKIFNILLNSFINLFTTKVEGFANINLIKNINFGPIIFYIIIFILIPFTMFFSLKK